MKKLLLRAVTILLGSCAILTIAGFAVYVYLYYPRTAEPFEIKVENPKKKILIATQSSEFKDTLVQNLCDSLRTSSVHIKGIDVSNLPSIKENEWDKIVIVNTFIIRLNRTVQRFVSQSNTPVKLLLFVTSGGADWEPQRELEVDAITSASHVEFVDDQVALISDWLGKDDNQPWRPADYLLALRFFPRVNVTAACDALLVDQERYKEKYPQLVHWLNYVGYQYLKKNDVLSALDVFKLNVNLFPDSWNVYDSYAESLLSIGDRQAAVDNYRKALALNPESTSSKKMLEELMSQKVD